MPFNVNVLECVSHTCQFCANIIHDACVGAHQFLQFTCAYSKDTDQPADVQTDQRLCRCYASICSVSLCKSTLPKGNLQRFVTVLRADSHKAHSETDLCISAWQNRLALSVPVLRHNMRILLRK